MLSKDKDIDIDYNIILKNNIPLLVNNPDWKDLFGDSNDKEINIEKEKLLELLREEKNYNRKLKKLQREKRDAMVNIVNLSYRVNKDDNTALENLDDSKNKIIEINDEIKDITFKLESIPKDIREENYELLKATIKVAYKELRERESKMDFINDEIEELRNRLKSLIEEKNDYEETIHKIYTYLHGMIGKNEIEKLDKEFFE
ncbi:hypothetical protein GOQ29_04235 [Clostridium sp. D2Q-14]|uniref:hypothetical protein n=1 Tax=Anaeromonas gelatinilytica TaxID=2683194 RepID=UPI00193B5FD9|nr:hypothetical protein [Anaeromonas gelatinilytica]MBS4534821.1 hypothetical protein [Anaeromonas gelatinilytica]